MSKVSAADRLRSGLNEIPLDRWYQPIPGFFTVAKEEGERVPRRVRQTYFDLVEQRPAGVRFETIPLLKRMIEKEVERIAPHYRGMLPFPLVLAYAHLEDAENTDLREKDREMHFDIAGSEIWQYREGTSSSQAFVGRFIGAWRDGNGV